MSLTSCEVCPTCSKSWAYAGLLGCDRPVACSDTWHCRLPRHQALRHLRKPALDVEAASGTGRTTEEQHAPGEH